MPLECRLSALIQWVAQKVCIKCEKAQALHLKDSEVIGQFTQRLFYGHVWVISLSLSIKQTCPITFDPPF